MNVLSFHLVLAPRRLLAVQKVLLLFVVWSVGLPDGFALHPQVVVLVAVLVAVLAVVLVVVLVAVLVAVLAVVLVVVLVAVLVAVLAVVLVVVLVAAQVVGFVLGMPSAKLLYFLPQGLAAPEMFRLSLKF